MVRSDKEKKTFYQNQTQVFFDMMITKCHTTVENDKWPLTEYVLQDINLGRDAILHQAVSEESLLKFLSGTVSNTYIKVMNGLTWAITIKRLYLIRSDNYTVKHQHHVLLESCFSLPLFSIQK